MAEIRKEEHTTTPPCSTSQPVNNAKQLQLIACRYVIYMEIPPQESPSLLYIAYSFEIFQKAAPCLAFNNCSLILVRFSHCIGHDPGIP